MKEIYANRKVRGTLTQLTLRFDGGLVYLKGSKEEIISNKDAVALVTKWESSGATIGYGETWAKINFCATDKRLEYNGKLIAEDIDEIPTEKVEKMFVNAFRKQLKKGNFALLVRDLKKVKQ